MVSRAVVQAGHDGQVQAYAEMAADGRDATNGVLCGGDFNEDLTTAAPVVRAMGEAGLRLIAESGLDGLFASGRFKCLEVEVLHPGRPADHPWLLVTVEMWNHSFRVLIANTHVGLAIPALRRTKRAHKPALVLVQEVQRPEARSALRRAFPKPVWSSVGFYPPSRGHQSSGTILLARRTTFSMRAHGNDLLTPYLDRMHPVRRMTWADLRHRRAGVTFRAICAHPWSLHA